MIFLLIFQNVPDMHSIPDRLYDTMGACYFFDLDEYVCDKGGSSAAPIKYTIDARYAGNVCRFLQVTFAS